MWKHCPKCRCHYSGKCPYCGADMIEPETAEPLRFVPLEPEYDEEEDNEDIFDTHSKLIDKGDQ